MVRRRAAPSPDDASHRRENHEAPLVPFILRDAAFAPPQDKVGQKSRRVGKGALAPCPPSILDRDAEWWARLRFAHPTKYRRYNGSSSLPVWSRFGVAMSPSS